MFNSNPSIFLLAKPSQDVILVPNKKGKDVAHLLNVTPENTHRWKEYHCQCDEIRLFFALWAIFQSLWQQLFGKNHQHFEAIFVKVSNSLISLVKIIFGQLL